MRAAEATSWPVAFVNCISLSINLTDASHGGDVSMGEGSLPPEIRDAIEFEANNQDGRQRARATGNRVRRPQPHPGLNSKDLSWVEATRERVWKSRYGRGKVPSCTIFKVPENIREANGQAYEPSVVSIGAFENEFYRSPPRLGAMQAHKWNCVLRLLQRHGDRPRADELLDECLATVKALEGRARQCYSERIYMGDPSGNRFPQMLLLDGCFILHLLLKQMKGTVENVQVVVVQDAGSVKARENGEENGNHSDEEEEEGEEEGIEAPMASSLWVWSLVKYDLLKLENQIPFFVIQSLFDVLRTPEDADVDLVEIALKLFSTLHPQGSWAPPKIRGDTVVHHLLHLFHMSLLPPSCVNASLPADEGGGVSTPSPGWIPSATELQEAGVKFERKKDAKTSLDVTFADGVMEIPPLGVYNYSNVLFRNLVAFEQCYPVWPYVTSYALFMDCIMRTPRDVRLLQLRGIVLNGQSTDEEVAKFFGRLCGQVQYAYDVNYLRELYVRVGEHYDSRWHRWQAVLRRDYFGNPWVVVSVVAAAALLLLTMEQAFFAAFAYFHPPK